MHKNRQKLFFIAIARRYDTVNCCCINSVRKKLISIAQKELSFKNFIQTHRHGKNWKETDITEMNFLVLSTNQPRYGFILFFSASHSQFPSSLSKLVKTDQSCANFSLIYPFWKFIACCAAYFTNYSNAFQ